MFLKKHAFHPTSVSSALTSCFCDPAIWGPWKQLLHITMYLLVAKSLSLWTSLLHLTLPMAPSFLKLPPLCYSHVSLSPSALGRLRAGFSLDLRSWFKSPGLSALAQSSLRVAQRLKRLPPMWETWVQSLGQEDPLEKEMATHSSILAWRIPWMEEPGRLQSTGSQRVGHDWATSLHFIHTLAPHQPEDPGWVFSC